MENGSVIEITELSKPEQPVGISLYRNDYELFVPAKPNIPLNEGLHIKVAGKHDSIDTPKQVLSRYLLGLAAAKAIAESGVAPEEPWANTRIEKDQGISVYGRNATNPISWRRPVDAHNRAVKQIETLEPNYNQDKLIKLFQRYIPRWEKLLMTMNLFENGVNGQDVLYEDGENNTVIWKNDKFNVVIVKRPHLNGYHLVVNPNETIARQWQTIKEKPEDVENQTMVQQYIQSTLEATAVALGVRQLISGGKGEIHNSGNWAAGLKTTNEEGALSLESLRQNPKREKKTHRPDIAAKGNDLETVVHAHVYIPENPESPVVLPPMSKKEAEQKLDEKVVEQWDSISDTTPQQISDIRERLGSGNLTGWVQSNCQGKLS